MVENVRGFLTRDGTFYKTKQEAEYHEATLALKERHAQSLNMHPEQSFRELVLFIQHNVGVVRSYCDCYNACNDLGETRPDDVYETFVVEGKKGDVTNEPDTEPHTVEAEDEESSSGRKRKRDTKERAKPAV